MIRTAVVVGGGVGSLAAAIALRKAGMLQTMSQPI
jgi:phytoene dehydrogenase-like protein